jgi:hypothetical protein
MYLVSIQLVRTWIILHLRHQHVLYCTWEVYACMIRQECNAPTTSGFLPGTTSYVYVRCRTYHVRHRTSDVRCRTQHRTYDIVRTMIHTTLNIRHCTFVNIVCATYDIVGQTYDIVRSMKSIKLLYFLHLFSNLRHRRSTYDIVCMTYDIVRLIMRSVPAAESFFGGNYPASPCAPPPWRVSTWAQLFP